MKPLDNLLVLVIPLVYPFIVILLPSFIVRILSRKQTRPTYKNVIQLTRIKPSKDKNNGLKES